MNNLIGVKNLKITLQIKFFKREEKTHQHFIFTDLKDRKHYDDNRFSIYYKLRKRIKELSLENLGFIIEEIIEQEDRIIHIYSGDMENPYSAYYNTINDFIAPFAGCDFCIYYNENNCEKMNKVMLKKKKNCMLFNQKEKLFST